MIAIRFIKRLLFSESLCLGLCGDQAVFGYMLITTEPQRFTEKTEDNSHPNNRRDSVDAALLSGSGLHQFVPGSVLESSSQTMDVSLLLLHEPFGFRVRPKLFLR